MKLLINLLCSSYTLFTIFKLPRHPHILPPNPNSHTHPLLSTTTHTLYIPHSIPKHQHTSPLSASSPCHPTSTQMLVLDEADEMLNKGFKEQIYDVYRYLPPATQVVLISATLPHEILEMTSKFMTDPIRILVKR